MKQKLHNYLISEHRKPYRDHLREVKNMGKEIMKITKPKEI